MKLRIRKKNASALSAVIFVVTVNVLSQSMGIVDEDVRDSPSLLCSSPLSHDSHLSGNQVDISCAVFTASCGETVLFGGNVDLRLQKISEQELNIAFFSAYKGGYKFVTLGRDWHMKGFRTRTNSDYYAGMNERGLAFAGSGVPLAPLTPHPERPFSGSSEDFSFKAMRECSNVVSVIELAQNFDWGDSINGQFHFADSTGDAVVISGGKEGELVFTRKEKGDGYLVSTNFNLATESGYYPCWRYDTATQMLEEIRSEHDLTADYAASVLDAIHIEGMWVNTAISYIFDLKNGDIYVYFTHQFEEVYETNLEEEMTIITVFSLLAGSYGDEILRSRIYFFHELYSEETIEKARSEVQKYERQYYVCMAAGVVVGAVILSGLSLLIYRKIKNRWKKTRPP